MAFRRISYQHYFENLQLLLTSKSDNPIESVSNAHVTELVSSTANYRTDGRTVTRAYADERTAATELSDRESEPEASSSCHWWPQQWASASRSRLAAATMGRRVITTDDILAAKGDLLPPLPLVQLGCIMSEISHRWRNLCLMLFLSVTSVFTLLKTVCFENRPKTGTFLTCTSW